MNSPKNLWSVVPAYIALQKLLGADRVRYRALDALELKSGEVIFDIGCGPAYYFERLPSDIVYHGFDTNQRYIDWSTRNFGDEGTFHCGLFDHTSARQLPRPNAILLLGLLHHLPDDEARDVVDLAASVLVPGGRVLALDTCFEHDKRLIPRWLAEHDRGEFVRLPEQFEELAAPSFASITGELVTGSWKMPGSYWLMRLSDPRTQSGAQ